MTRTWLRPLALVAVAAAGGAAAVLSGAPQPWAALLAFLWGGVVALGFTLFWPSPSGFQVRDMLARPFDDADTALAERILPHGFQIYMAVGTEIEGVKGSTLVSVLVVNPERQESAKGQGPTLEAALTAAAIEIERRGARLQ